MKNLFLLCALAISAHVGFAQNVLPSQKVKQGFEKTALQSFSDSQIEYWNYYADNAFVVHSEAKTTEGIPLLSTVLKPGKASISGATITQENFNPFHYNITPLASETQLFIIDGTSKMVQVRAQSSIDMYYDMYLTNKANKAKLEKSK